MSAVTEDFKNNHSGDGVIYGHTETSSQDLKPFESLGGGPAFEFASKSPKVYIGSSAGTTGKGYGSFETGRIQSLDGDTGNASVIGVRPSSHLTPQMRTTMYSSEKNADYSRDEGYERPYYITLFLAIKILQGDTKQDGIIRSMFYGELEQITRNLSASEASYGLKVVSVDYFAGQPQQFLESEILGLCKLYPHQNLVLHFIAHGKTNDHGLSRGAIDSCLGVKELENLTNTLHKELRERFLMFFNVCNSDGLAYGASQITEDDGDSFVAAIGFKGSLPEPLAKRFASRFYSDVFAGFNSVKGSFDAAKTYIETERFERRLCRAEKCPEVESLSCSKCNPNKYVQYGAESIWGWRLSYDTSSYADRLNIMRQQRKDNALCVLRAGGALLSAQNKALWGQAPREVMKNDADCVVLAR